MIAPACLLPASPARLRASAARAPVRSSLLARSPAPTGSLANSPTLPTPALFTSRSTSPAPIRFYHGDASLRVVEAPPASPRRRDAAHRQSVPAQRRPAGLRASLADENDIVSPQGQLPAELLLEAEEAPA